MACDEMLIHTDDAARGLGLPRGSSQDLKLAGRVLARLFPWHDPAPTRGRRCCGRRAHRPARTPEPDGLGLALWEPRTGMVCPGTALTGRTKPV